MSDAAHLEVRGQWSARPGHGVGPDVAAAAHAALLITLDATGIETTYDPEDLRAIGHPQATLATDADETPPHATVHGIPTFSDADRLPPQRRWGCLCGWRGAVRDVSGRHYRPRVGDGGQLGARRVARDDRDSRAELDTHLGTCSPGPAAVSSVADPPLTAVTMMPTQAPDPAPPTTVRRPRRPLTLDRAAQPGPPPSPASSKAGSTPHRGDQTDQPAGPPTPAEAAAPVHEPEPASPDSLEIAAAAADRARETLAAAEAGLDEAVQRARSEGTSWRAIARRVGTDHRSAQRRWGNPDDEHNTL